MTDWGWMSCGFSVDIIAVAFCQCLHFLHHITFGRFWLLSHIYTTLLETGRSLRGWRVNATHAQCKHTCTCIYTYTNAYTIPCAYVHAYSPKREGRRTGGGREVLKDFFIDLVEKIVEPCKQQHWGKNEMDLVVSSIAGEWVTQDKLVDQSLTKTLENSVSMPLWCPETLYSDCLHNDQIVW